MSQLSVCIVAVLSMGLQMGRVDVAPSGRAVDLTAVARESAWAAPDAPARSARGVSNDSCFEPLTIIEGDTDFITVGADTDGLPHADCQFDGQTYRDIWFQFVADCAEELTVSTCNSAGYNTDLAVYDGCIPELLCPPDGGFLLACNDDALGCEGFTSEVSVPVIAGNCYTIRVGGGNDGDEGIGTLTLTCDGGLPCNFDGVCDDGENACSCPLECPGDCCVTYTAQPDFEAALADSGGKLLGIENFEESILPPASVVSLDDPLCGGVPNLPEGFPFPQGLLTDMCVQSNLDHAPESPNPRGVSGLAAASDGFLGAVSDVVLANYFSDSLDLITTDQNPIGVGFDTLSFFGGMLVEIEIYDTADNFLSMGLSAADPGGLNFFGVVCEVPIGRINIFDTGNGAEGADNVRAWGAPPGAECGNLVIEDGEECDPPDGVTCDADCQLILCGLDEQCCCCADAGCLAIDLVPCADKGCTPVEECLGDSNEDGEDDACVDACCLANGSCKPLTEDECAGEEGVPVQACIGDQDGDGRDDACPCEVDADCDDGNPCTFNICDQATGMCLIDFAPKSTPCEIDGVLCSIEHCDGKGSCVPFGEVVCEAACPACEGECDPETGLCPCAGAKVDGDWSDDIWNLEGPNPYPDNNTGVPGLGAVIQGIIDVFLDLTVEIESLCLLEGGILRVTAGGAAGPAGDIRVFGPEGILIEGTLFVADSHVIDASAGPVTIGANGKYLADPAAIGDVNTVLLADELTMLEGEFPNDPGTMELSDSMQVSTSGDFKLDGTNFSDKGDCTPPDLNVINSGQIEVGGNFIILNAAQVEYSSSVSMLLEGNFDNQSKFPLFFDWTDGGVLLTGGSGNVGPTVHTVEAAGEDFGRCAKGFIDNFALGTLELQSEEIADIVNLIDNQDDGGKDCDEALYVQHLIVNNDAVLNTNGCRVYYRELTNDGLIPDLGVDVLEIERADFNEDCFVSAEDLANLLGDWGLCPDPCPPFCTADLSDNCLVDAFDLAILLGKWGPVN